MKSKENFEAYILNYIDEKIENKQIQEMVKYGILNGGKKFRPLLFLSLFEECEQKNYYDLALAIEFTHTYSLIHDDLPAMDNDLYRRGNLSLWNKYGENNAILIGDGLISQAFDLICFSNLNSDLKIKLLKAFIEKTGFNGMVLGQFLDVNNFSKTEKQINFMYEKKTGDMLCLCFVMFAIIKKYDICEYDNLGKNLGLLFQYQDDIIELKFSNSEKNDSDLKNCKNTSLTVIENLNEKIILLKEEILNKMQTLNLNSKTQKLIKKIVSRDENE